MDFFEIFRQAWPGSLSGLTGVIGACHGACCCREVGEGAGPC